MKTIPQLKRLFIALLLILALAAGISKEVRTGFQLGERVGPALVPP